MRLVLATMLIASGVVVMHTYLVAHPQNSTISELTL
jgi:hypothetical protein